MIINEPFYNNLKKYLLVRCFDRIEYLNSFIDGSCIHLNPIQLYRNSDNSFQGDSNDCAVLKSGTRFKGKVFIGNGKPEIEIGEMELDSFSLDGYLYCFFSLPKEFFKVENGEVLHDMESAYFKDYYMCMEQYRRNSATKKCYVVILDAYNLVMRMNQVLDNVEEIHYSCGFVDYRELSTTERLTRIAEKDINSIVFTKDPEYKYQREFRYYVSDKLHRPFIELTGQSLSDISFMTFEHNPNNHDISELINK